MKYDILEKFKRELYRELSPNTAKKYYSSIVKLFESIQFSDIRDIPAEYIEAEIKCLFKTKNNFSAVKNALKRMKKMYPALVIPTEEYFAECSRSKKNHSKKPKKILSLKGTKEKIASIDNEKLQIAYRLAMAGGLRISEVAAIEKKDICFSQEERVLIHVTHGKGGANGIVECSTDPVFYEELQKYLSEQEEGRLFYSEAYMREKAYHAGFEPHDLRRIFSQVERRELSQEMSTYQANKEVQKKLRHARFSTTKRYLFNRKLIFDMKEDEGR